MTDRIRGILKDLLFKYIPHDGIYLEADIDQALTAIKQEILGKLPPMKNLYTTPQERLITQYESGFNDCLAQVRKIIEDEAQVKKLEEK